MHGGSVTVASEEGVGSRFVVKLPLLASEQIAPVENEEAVGAAGKRTGRILVVEDNVVNQKVLQAVLTKRGYSSALAGDGAEALRMMAAEAFDLVVMDVQMPGMDGLEATRQIRRNEAWRQLPVVALTAHAMSGDRERCLEAGMNAYLTKPIDSRELLRTLDRYLLAAAGGGTQPPAGGTGETVQQFLQLAPDRLDRLQQAVAGDDAEGLAAEARQVQAAAQTIAANRVADRARKLEDAAAARDVGAIRHSLLLLESEIARLSRQSEPMPARPAR
jgi:two-component system sensor histidine kinase/response regulator